MTDYKIPERVALMHTNHLYGTDETERHATVKDYLAAHNFALTKDLLEQGFEPRDIEEAVNSGVIGFAHWPEEGTKTDIYWSKDEKTLQKLDELAEKAVEFCYGDPEGKAVGGNIESVAIRMETSQTEALIGLVYAREQGKLKEIPEMGRGIGPLYVTTGSLSDQMFEFFSK